MRTMLVPLAAIATLALAVPASATITFTIADQGSGQGQVVLLNDSNIQGNTVLGHTNQTNDGITFQSTQVIGDAPNGQALIGAFTAVGGTATTLNNLTFFATDPLLAFGRVEFNLTNVANQGDALSVTLFGLDQFGEEFMQSFDTKVNGQGSAVGTNWIVGTATAGEVITRISFTTPTGTGFSDFRQLRVDIVSADGNNPNAVPEPATWAMMVGGFGLLGGAMRRRGRQVSVSA